MPAPKKTFRRYDPDQMLLLPPDLRDWLPEDHLAYFISDVVEELDLAPVYARYVPAPGYPPYDPKMLFKLLAYAYSIGLRSSRQISLATRESIAFRVLASNNFPDFRTICRFRTEHAEAFRMLFRQVVRLCAEEGLVRLEVVSLDGTKIKANANIERNKEKEDLQKELDEIDDNIDQIMKEAENADEEEDERLGDDDGNPLPPSLRRRDGRRQRIAESLRQLKEAEEKSEAELKSMIEERRRLDQEQAAKGKKVRGRKPKLEPKVRSQRRNPSDLDSRIMIAQKGFVQAYNAQAVVDCDSQVIVAEVVAQDCNDECQLLPMMEEIEINMDRRPEKLLADAGYFNTSMIEQVDDVDLYIATQKTYDTRMQRPTPRKERAPTVMETMSAKLLTEEGHAIFARRSRTVECVFGNVKENRGVRRFLCKGLGRVRSEWTLACLGHNLRKLWSDRIGPRIGLAQTGKKALTAG